MHVVLGTPAATAAASWAQFCCHVEHSIKQGTNPVKLITLPNMAFHIFGPNSLWLLRNLEFSLTIKVTISTSKAGDFLMKRPGINPNCSKVKTEAEKDEKPPLKL